MISKVTMVFLTTFFLIPENTQESTDSLAIHNGVAEDVIIVLHYSDKTSQVLTVASQETKSLALHVSVDAVEINGQSVPRGHSSSVQLPSENWIRVDFTNSESLNFTDY